MIFTESKLNGVEKTLETLEPAMHSLGFVTHNWDYDKATYDLMLKDAATNQTYYLRILGHILSGNMENPNALLKLNTPVIGRHLFPHGIDYKSEVPSTVAEQAKEVIGALEAKLGA